MFWLIRSFEAPGRSAVPLSPFNPVANLPSSESRLLSFKSQPDFLNTPTHRHILLWVKTSKISASTAMWIARLRPPSLRGSPLHRSLSTLRNRNPHRGPRNSIIRPEPIPSSQRPAEASEQVQPASAESKNAYNATYDPSQNTLLSPVHIPEDPNAVLKENHPATKLLANSGLVVQRQLEMINVMM